MGSGHADLVSLRLRIQLGRITEAEAVLFKPGGGGPNNIDAVDDQGIADPIWFRTVSPDKRLSRQQMISIADAYFSGVQKNDGRGVNGTGTYPFTPDCHRIENGSPTTNVPGNSGPFGMDCLSAFKMGYYFVVQAVHGRRYPLVDAERGHYLGALRVRSGHGQFRSAVGWPGVYVPRVQSARQYPRDRSVPDRRREDPPGRDDRTSGGVSHQFAMGWVVGQLTVRLKADPTDAPMTIRFADGAGYEPYMGAWSRLAGDTFLDWLAPEPGLRWLDVGCGNGAFTEMIVDRCAPVSVQGIDPLRGQLAFARTRPASRARAVSQGDAMALPFPDDTFDAAVMPLVIFFVPDPAVASRKWRGWSVRAASSPPTRGTCLAVGFRTSRCRRKCARWASPFAAAEPRRLSNRRDAGACGRGGSGGRRDAGDHRATDVRRFRRLLDDHPSGAERRSEARRDGSDEIALLKARMRARLPADANGRITCIARANAVKGRVKLR